MALEKKLVLALILLTVIATVNATHNITMESPTDGDTCVVGDEVLFKYFIEGTPDYCELYHNNTGSWILEKMDYSITANAYNSFNDTIQPNFLSWGLFCVDSTPAHSEWSDNYTFTLTDAPYCAVLDNVNCTSYPRIDNYGFFKFRLSNTLGLYLENQDCNIWVEDSNGIPVKTYDTMMYNQNVELHVDDEGNWININPTKVPLTDSLGWYLFSYYIDPSWGWYNDNYTIHTNCNGQTASCGFQVKEHRAYDTEEGVILLKKFGGMLVVLACLVVLLVLGWRTIRSRGFWRMT